MRRQTLQDEIAYIKKAGALTRSVAGDGQQLLRLIDLLNSKSSALLVHLSIMIVVLGLMIEKDPSGSFRGGYINILLILELIVYSILSIYCLRCVFVTSPSTFFEHEDIFERMLAIHRQRRRAYLTTFRATVVVTLAFIVTLIVKTSALLR